MFVAVRLQFRQILLQPDTDHRGLATGSVFLAAAFAKSSSGAAGMSPVPTRSMSCVLEGQALWVFYAQAKSIGFENPAMSRISFEVIQDAVSFRSCQGYAVG